MRKSIEYNVWVNIPAVNKRLDAAFLEAENKRLDAAFLEAENKASAKEGSCAVFLFFSVNASGQFCGVAEMAGDTADTAQLPNGFSIVFMCVLKTTLFSVSNSSLDIVLSNYTREAAVVSHCDVLRHHNRNVAPLCRSGGNHSRGFSGDKLRIARTSLYTPGVHQADAAAAGTRGGGGGGGGGDGVEIVAKIVSRIPQKLR
ncbi:unnamed protein product [Sphagnum jensenii]|uniref:YTH domain-containing protein n=1 Tax=Sphagnum jensenii TaxID=128206 RepID=A0ABP1C1S5_9BRYO